MKKLVSLFSLSLLLGCGDSPDPILPDSPPSRKSHRSVCYQGPLKKYDTCLETTSLTKNSQDYIYPNPFSDEFPSHRNPHQYLSPSFYINLGTADLNLPLAPNFKLSEFLSPQKGNYGVLSPQVLDKIQAVREMARGPIRVTSGFRSPGYNERISGSAKWSRHMYGDAIDFYSDTASLDDLMEYCERNGASFYQKYTSHVHCDWRDLPLPNGFFQPHEDKVPPSESFNSLKAYLAHTKIKTLKNKRAHIKTLIAEHPEAEDAGELVYKWTVRNSKNEVQVFSTKKIQLSATDSPYEVELNVGGSLVVHQKLTW